MTSSTTNTLRNRFNSLRVSFFKSVCICLQKEKDLGGNVRGEGV